MGFENDFDSSFENIQPDGPGFEEQEDGEDALGAGIKARRMRRTSAQSRRDRMGRRGYSPDGESDVDIMAPDKPVRISEGRRPQQPTQGVVSDRSEFTYLYSNAEPQDVHMSSERSERLDALAYDDQSGEQYDTILDNTQPEPMVRTRSALDVIPEGESDSIGYPSMADYGYSQYAQQEEAPARSSRFSRRSTLENREEEAQVNNYYQPQQDYYQPAQEQQPEYAEPMYAQPEPQYAQPQQYAQPEPQYVRQEQEYYRTETAPAPAKYPQQFYPQYADEYPVYPQYPSYPQYPQYPQPYPYGAYPQYPLYPQYPVYPQPQYVQPVQPQVQPCVQLFVNTASQPYVMPQQYQNRSAQPYQAPVHQEEQYRPVEPTPVQMQNMQQNIQQNIQQSAPIPQPVQQNAPVAEPVQPVYSNSEPTQSAYCPPEPIQSTYTAPEPAPELAYEPYRSEPFGNTQSAPSYYQPDYQPEPTAPQESAGYGEPELSFELRRDEPTQSREIPADIQSMMSEDSGEVAKPSRFNRRKKG